MRQFLLISSLFLLSQFAQAQIENHKRFELEYEWRDEDYLLISNEQLGLTLVQADYKGLKEYTLSIKQLDTDFNQKWEKVAMIKRGFELLGYHYVQGKTYLMLQEFPSRFKIKILSIDNRTGEIQEYNPKEILELDIQEFEVIQNTAVIGGYFESRPVVFAFDLKNDKIKTLTNVYQNESKLLEIRVNSDSLTFNVLATEYNRNRDQTIKVNTYDYLGNAVRDYELQTQKDYHLTSAISSSINDISQVVVGVYSYKATNSPAGMFINHVDRTGLQTMKYYGFGELEDFFSYLGEKKATRYKEKAEAVRKKGKEVRYRVQPLFAEMIEDDDQLIVFGEFLRSYNHDTDHYVWAGTNYPTGFRSQGANTDNNSQERASFQFTHAYTLVLDKKGNIQWDDWLEVPEDGKGIPEPFGGFIWDKNQGTYVYYFEKEVHAKAMDGEEDNDVIVDNVQLSDPEDKLRYENENSSGTLRWYDKYFIVYGVQSIRSGENNGDLRKVFFINKISLNPNQKGNGID
ncbi:hypothetical protein OB69_09380 [Roseivirga seohaensis subsp. aquiponti]|uniref:Uncharacterized protein n=1 Tax=Roseivirga seohaensis subsp. aquiponti TaxID=1566026 RepID=A0A0L8ALC8_9BACT|nr:hypothetical protein [Roseivirga seohaensis]KOF03022.1 hypothetical protein OB69_09380 [Roseivirga seohaensis subsp. aquiponti]